MFAIIESVKDWIWGSDSAKISTVAVLVMAPFWMYQGFQHGKKMRLEREARRGSDSGVANP